MKSIRLLQWNIWTKEKPENIVQLIKQLKPDIVCLQEVTINSANNNYINMPDFLEKNLKLKIHFQEAQYWPTDRGRESQGNAILTKHTMTSTNHEFIQDTKHSDWDNYANEGRVIVMAKIDLQGHSLEVATTHMSYTHRFQETPAKLTEANKLLSIVKEKERRFILTGDFNSTEDSMLISKLGQVLVHAGPEFNNKTWTTKPFSYRGFKTKRLNWRLDYVFTTPDIRVMSAEIINTPFSDHLPILLELNLS